MKTAFEILAEKHDYIQKNGEKPSEYNEDKIIEAMEEYASQFRAELFEKAITDETIINLLQEAYGYIFEEEDLTNPVIIDIQKAMYIYGEMCRVEASQLKTELPSKRVFEIDFDGHLKAMIEISENRPKVIAAMSGFGNPVLIEGITIK